MDWVHVYTVMLYAGMIYTCYGDARNELAHVAAMLPFLLLPLIPFGRVWGLW